MEPDPLAVDFNGVGVDNRGAAGYLGSDRHIKRPETCKTDQSDDLELCVSHESHEDTCESVGGSAMRLVISKAQLMVVPLFIDGHGDKA